MKMRTLQIFVKSSLPNHMLAFAAFSRSLLIAPHEEKSFLAWMRETNNIFVGDEYHFRMGIFLANKRYVENFNRNGAFKVGLNNLAHLTQTEYKQMLGVRLLGKEKEDIEISPVRNFNAPDALDWRDKGIVNPVKDQGHCGSCWAFSTIQAQESQWALHHPGELYSLAEQQLVDCVRDCFGCNGGIPAWAMTYVKLFEHGLFMLESDYPYTAKDGHCAFDKSKGITKITTHTAGSKNEESLKEQLAENGVYSICIDASHTSFQLYTSGIYEEPACSSSTLDHAVGLVGYGSENGKDFWIVRNSWSETWGEKGYVRIRRNFNNHCGVASEAKIPVVA